MIDESLLCDVWMKAMCVKLGCLAQGYGNSKGTDTINFMSLDEIPNISKDRTVTQVRIVVDSRKQKKDPNRVRITVGGMLIEYPYKLKTCTAADLTTSKIMWNNAISTMKARYICADVKQSPSVPPSTDLST